MARRKKFKLYADYIKQVESLNDTQAGRLFKAILAEVNSTEYVPKFSKDAAMAFDFIKAQLDEDATTYARNKVSWAENAKKGGRTKKVTGEEEKPQETASTRPETHYNETEKPKEEQKRKKMEYPEGFEQFWKAYPRHVDKGMAYQKYKIQINSGFKPEELLKAAENYAAECRKNKTEEKFIKHPKTFLGPGGSFEEYIKKEPAPAYRGSYANQIDIIQAYQDRKYR